MRRLIESSSLSSVFLASVVLAAGCGNSTMVSGGADGGVVTHDMATGSTPDMTSAGDMAMPAVLAGTILSPGQFILLGITTDDQIIGANLKGGALTAVAAAGGKTTIVSAMNSASSIHGKTVFSWAGITSMVNVGALTVWNAGLGAPATVAMTSIGGVSATSDDGSLIFYSDNALSDASAADIYVSKIDGSGAHKIATAANATMTCDPFGHFTKNNKFVFRTCDSGIDGGAMGAAIFAVDPATGASKPLLDGLGDFFAVDPNGTYALVTDTNMAALLVPIAGGKPIMVDTAFKDGLFLPDGSAIIYVTMDGKLKRATVGANPAPVTLVGSNVTVFQKWFASQTTYPALSADGKWIMISNVFDPKTGLGDLSIASTLTPGAAIPISTDPKSIIFGDPFTSDSKYTLFYTGLSQVTAGLVGKFVTTPITGGMPAQFAKSVWVSFAGTGSLAVYNDNYKPGLKGSNGRGDLRSADAASPTMSKLLATQAEADFYMTAKKDKAAYAYTINMTQAGIYIVPIQ